MPARACVCVTHKDRLTKIEEGDPDIHSEGRRTQKHTHWHTSRQQDRHTERNTEQMCLDGCFMFEYQRIHLQNTFERSQHTSSICVMCKQQIHTTKTTSPISQISLKEGQTHVHSCHPHLKGACAKSCEVHLRREKKKRKWKYLAKVFLQELSYHIHRELSRQNDKFFRCQETQLFHVRLRDNIT